MRDDDDEIDMEALGKLVDWAMPLLFVVLFILIVIFIGG